MEVKEKLEVVNINNIRNYGIDALKVLSMFMVVVLHVLGKGGFLGAFPLSSPKCLTVWFVEFCSYCAVNCFAMITGYLMVERRFKYSKIISLWVQVVFYQLLIYILDLIFFKQGMSLKQSLMPACYGTYWYFSCYFALFFLIPFLNRMLNSINKKEYTILIITMFILFSLMSTIRDSVGLNSGYSLIWLIIMYITGGYIKKYDIFNKIKNYWLLIIYFACALITWFNKTLLSPITASIFGKEKFVGLLDSYFSPTVVIMSLSLMLFFLRIKMPHNIAKLMAFLSPLSFSVYLIHEHPVIKAVFLQDKFLSFCKYNSLTIIAVVLLISLIIYTVSTILEYARTNLFRLLKIELLIKNIGSNIDNLIKIN